jgi:hypothetical protein
LTVDVEALVTTFLRGQSAVTALVADRVYSDLPHERTYPLVLVNRVGGGYTYKTFLEEADVEIAAHGGSHKQAQSLANTCLVSMAQSIVGSHTEGVVTKVKATSVVYQPEVDSADPQGHARPRFLVSVTVTTHP